MKLEVGTNRTGHAARLTPRHAFSAPRAGSAGTPASGRLTVRLSIELGTVLPEYSIPT